MSDVTIDLAENSLEVHQRHAEPWRVTLVDTGMDSQTGGRLGRVRSYVQDDAEFCMTYGDGVGDIDIRQVIDLSPVSRQACNRHRDAAAGPLRCARNGRAIVCCG